MTRSQKDTPIGPIADDWQLAALRDISARPQYGYATSASESGTHRFLRITDIKDYSVDWSTVPMCECTPHDAAKYQLIENDIVFARIGATTGKSHIIKTAPAQSVFASYLIRVRPTGIDPDFLYFFFQSSAYWRQVSANMHNNLKKGMNATVLQSLQVPLPPRTEQCQISDLLSNVVDGLRQLARLERLAVELKESLAQVLFSRGTRGGIPAVETPVGLVPSNWAVKSLGRAVPDIDYGLSRAIPKSPPRDGVKIVTTAEITRDGVLRYDKIRRITAPARAIDRLMLRNGDVLFNWRNSLSLIGKTAVYEEQPDAHIFASFVLRLRCDEKETHNHYLKHLFNHMRERAVFVRLARRAVNQANFNRNEIAALPVPLPSYSEQREIAAQLDMVEQRRTHLTRRREVMVELFRALVDDLMSGRMRVKGRVGATEHCS
ncbi:MAG: restriction endonuclease subunit S [Proteobacteria bacterium]|nr:restriction endonuclease subunit S [Pseudomonadota bacterium]